MKSFSIILTVSLLILYTSYAQTQIGPNMEREAGNDYADTSVNLSNDGTPTTKVYDLSTSNQWNQAENVINDQGSGDYIGHSVAISGDGTTLVSGAVYASPANLGVAGSPIFSHYDGNNWRVLGDWCGRSVVLDIGGTSISIGAHTIIHTRDMQEYTHVLDQSDCTGMNNLTGTENNITKYETDGIIESIQTIKQQLKYSYDSALEIELKPGFCMGINAIFYTYIEVCLDYNNLITKG